MSPRKPDLSKADAILDAALELFVERGYHGTAVPEIARRAGVGAGTIYRHFQSKEAVVNALFRQWKTLLSQMVLEDFPFSAPAREQFQYYWRRNLEFARQYPRAQVFLELHHHADYLDKESRALEERIHQAALGIVDSMRAQSAVKDLPSLFIIAIVYGVLMGVTKAAWHEHLELTDEVIQSAERCAWEAVRA